MHIITPENFNKKPKKTHKSTLLPYKKVFYAFSQLRYILPLPQNTTLLFDFVFSPYYAVLIPPLESTTHQLFPIVYNITNNHL